MSKLIAEEVVQTAVKVETIGEEFYKKAAIKAKSEEVKKTFTFLAMQEHAHAEKFSEILKSVKFEVSEDTAENEYDAYFKAIASRYIFTPKLLEKALAGSFDDEKEVLEFALKIEADSVLTYIALKDKALNDTEKIIDKIIEEEKKHYAIIAKLLTKF